MTNTTPLPGNTPGLPDRDDLIADAMRLTMLCELATDLIDHVSHRENHAVRQLSALLYTMHNTAEALTRQIDQLNEGT